MSTRAGPSVAQSVMMQLGSFQFCIATAAYNDLTRRTQFRWPSQERFGKLAALQFTGPGEDSMTLAGIIYPEYVGSQFMLARMRALAGRGRPLPLISGAGATMGRWVIESVEEKQATFAMEGMPRRQDFTLQLKLFDVRQAEQTGIAAAVGAASSVVGAATGATPAAQVQTGFRGFVDNATKTAGDAVKSLSTTLTAFRDKAQEIGDAVGPVVASVQQGISTARALQDAANALKNGIKNIHSLSDAQTAMYSVMSAASAASNAGALASSVINDVIPGLLSSGVASDTIGVAKQCQAACGRLAVSSSGMYSQGVDLLKSATSIFE